MKKILVFFVLISFFATSLHAQSNKKFQKYYTKGKSYFKKLNYKEALPYFEQAEKVLVGQSGNEKNYPQLLGEMAESYASLKNYEKSTAYYLNAISQTEQQLGTLHPSLPILGASLAKVYYRNQRYEKAEPIAIKALQQFEASNSIRSNAYGELLTSLGTIYLQKGMLVPAVNYSEQAFTFYTTQGTNTHAYFSALNNLAVAYSMSFEYTKAITHYQLLLETKDKIPAIKPIQYASIFSNRGALYFNQQKNTLAEKDWEEASSFYVGNHNEDANYATLKNNLGILYTSTNQLSKAEDALRTALNLREKTSGKTSIEYATALMNLAIVYRHQDKYEKATDYLNQVESIRKDRLGELHPDYTLYLNERGNLLAAQLNDSKAIPLYSEAVANTLAYSKKNFPGMSEREKIAYMNAYGRPIDDFFNFSAHVLITKKTTGLTEEEKILARNNYTTRINSKGIVLQDLQKTRAAIFASKDSLLIESYSEWEKLKNSLARASTLSVEEQKTKEIDLLAMEEKANAFEKKISLSSESFKKINSNKTISWIEVQQKLTSKEVAIEIIRSTSLKDTVYFALLLTAALDSPIPVLITKEGRLFEQRYLTYYKNCIRFNIKDEFSYNQFWKPIADKLQSMGNFTTIYLSVDGAYHQLNPASLFNTKTDTYLGENHTLHLVTNTLEITKNKITSFHKKKALLVGNPDFTLETDSLKKKSASEDEERSYNGTLFSELPGTDIELTKVNNLLVRSGWKTTVLSRERASEDNLKLVNNPTVLHIATHGFFINKSTLEPYHSMLLSGVALAGINARAATKKQEDGILTAYESMNLDLDSTDLVVLSACETGLGAYKTGEGVYGIQRGLRVSGAKTILMSLWKVDDKATQELMVAFYNEWIKTGNKREAFANAQQVIKKKYLYPYYWAAFVMIGE